MNLFEVILRNLFAPSRSQIWAEVAKHTGAKIYDDSRYRAGKMILRHRNWHIVLDILKQGSGKNNARFTRIRAPYITKDGFTFNIYREGFFSNLGKQLGMEDFEVGYPDFDEQFIIKGNDYYKLMKFLDNQNIRSLMQRHPKVSLEALDTEGFLISRYPKDVYKLEFIVRGVIKDVELLVILFFLFKETLDQLVEIGAAYERDPEVMLQ